MPPHLCTIYIILWYAAFKGLVHFQGLALCHQQKLFEDRDCVKSKEHLLILLDLSPVFNIFLHLLFLKLLSKALVLGVFLILSYDMLLCNALS